jgi:hypothetical protein
MKKLLTMMALIAIATTACQWKSMKKETSNTDSTMVIDTAMPIIDTVTLSTDTTSVN